MPIPLLVPILSVSVLVTSPPFRRGTMRDKDAEQRIRMTRPLPTDPIARAMGSELRPGQFISYTVGRSLITALEAVEAQRKALIASGQAVQASGYYELFIAACEEKANEIDESGSNFHDFVAWLFCGWVQAREA